MKQLLSLYTLSVPIEENLPAVQQHGVYRFNEEHMSCKRANAFGLVCLPCGIHPDQYKTH